MPDSLVRRSEFGLTGTAQEVWPGVFRAQLRVRWGKHAIAILPAGNDPGVKHPKVATSNKRTVALIWPG
jgi:hypothetical protein